MLSDSELATLVKNEISLAEGFDDDQITQNRKEALDYFYGRPRGDEVAGNSEVQSLDLADMTEAVLAQMMPAFSMDTLVMFEPDSDQDLQQSVLESKVCNNQIMERNRGYWILSETIKDALLLRNAVCNVFVSEEITVETLKLVGVDDVTIALAIAEAPENEDRELTSIKEIEPDLFDASIKSTTTERRLVVRAVDPTTFIINAEHDSIFIDGARFIAERSYPTRTDLILAGFDKKVVDDLPNTSLDEKIDTQARRRDFDHIGRRGSELDRSMQTVEQYEAYFRVDKDEDGIAELRHLLIVGSTILMDEVVEFSQYVSGSAFVNPHSYTSLSLFDKLKNVQDLKTKALRQWVDNVENNNQVTTVAVEGQTNLDDLISSRPGKTIRVRSPDAVRELPMQDIGASSNALLDYADKMRSERGGASLDLQNASLQLAGDTAHGIERQIGSKEQLAALMTRNISESLIRSLYLLVHKVLRTQMPGEIVTRIGGEFQSIDPGTWQSRDRVNVKTGLSVQERGQMKMALESIVAKQTELFGGGMDGVLVSLQNYHNALTDWGRASMIDNPERYFVDPNSQGAQQASQAKQEQNQAASDQEEELNQMVFGMQNQLEQMKIENDRLKAEQELQFKYFDARLDAEVAEAKIVGDATLKLVQGNQNAEANSQ